MTKLLARRPRYDGRHRACAIPGCPTVARHRVGTCTPAPAAAELAGTGVAS
jgi:hypothetical protein